MLSHHWKVSAGVITLVDSVYILSNTFWTASYMHHKHNQNLTQHFENTRNTVLSYVLNKVFPTKYIIFKT